MARHGYLTLGSSQRERVENTWALPAVGLLVTSSIAIALTVLNAQEWRSSEEMASTVLARRSTIAIGVQIISHILGWIQVQIVCNVIASSLRVALPLRAFSLDSIRFVTAISKPSVAWRARWLFNIASILFVALSLVPGALWSGAITPTFVEKITKRQLDIPTFQSENLTKMWEPGETDAIKANGFFTDNLWMTNNGLFTFSLAISSIRGGFLASASTASNTTGPESLRSKFDQTGFHHYNRSFGVGAGAGLIKIPDTVAPLWYTYSETGFVSTASCKYNQTSEFGIRYIVDNESIYNLRFQSSGKYPNGMEVPSIFPQITPRKHDIFIWSVKYANRKTYIPMASQDDTEEEPYQFKQFNKVQCEMTYQPRKFSVKVNQTEKTMLVTTSDDAAVEWPDYGDTVLSRLDDPFLHYSADESMYFGSQLGHSIVVNINQLRLMNSMEDGALDQNNATRYRALEEYLESLWDNGLGMLLATRLIGANKTMPVEAQVGLPAVKYGAPIYIYAVLVISIIVLLIFVAEAVRTRGWAKMANLELSDVGSVMLSASEGGTALAEKAQHKPPEDVGKILVRLRSGKAGDREALTVQVEENGGDHRSLERYGSQIPLSQLSSQQGSPRQKSLDSVRT